MIENQERIETKLWAIADEIRDLDPNEIKNYFLGFIFYKFLSEKLENCINSELRKKEIDFIEDYEEGYLKEEMESKAIEKVGYFLKPKYLFRNVSIDAKNGGYVLNEVQKAFKNIEKSTIGQKSEKAFVKIFEDIKLDSSKIGENDIDRNFTISRILINLNTIDFQNENSSWEDVFEYLISKFAASSSKKEAEFYTPKNVSELLAKIVTVGKDEIKSVYDPTCGSGSLLLKIKDELKVDTFFGQEINSEIFNIARMNMIIHNVSYENFDIRQGNTLENPQHLDQRFEVILANPPFSRKWESAKNFIDDERFKTYNKLIPSSKADFAFIQHMIYQLEENGIMAVVMPHGVLFRGATEGKIRKYLIEKKNYLDAVIGLPANVFYGTAMPTVILVFKKSRDNSDILFIDASKSFERSKFQNIIDPENIHRILDAYKTRVTIDRFAYVASLDEVRENDFNLNIPRYVDVYEEKPVDKDKIIEELENIGRKIGKIDEKIIKYCDELKIAPPIFFEDKNV